MTDRAALLERASLELGAVAGPLRLVLAARRGMSRAKLRNWAEALRRVADILEEIANVDVD